MKKINIAVLASGRGTNLQAIINAARENRINAAIKAVISDNKNAMALKRAEKYNIKAIHLNPKDFSSKKEYEREIIRVIDGNKIDLICLAGYMRVIGRDFVRKYKGRIINIHPSLLPSFPGTSGQKDALEYGVKFSGCTVHFVNEGVDTGPIIIQSVVPVKESDNVETLSARILREEHKIYIKAINLFAKNKLKINGRKVKVAG